MSRKRRVFGASFKAQVALAAVRGDKTAAELAGKFQVYPSQVMTWKKQLLEQAPELFEDGRRNEPPQRTLPIEVVTCCAVSAVARAGRVSI